jgi:asparagine synthase (glutamine-hydrolysing)
MVKLDATHSNTWYHTKGVWAKGYCFDTNNTFVHQNNLSELFSTITSEESLQNLLNQVNGIFSVIIERNDAVYAIMDKTRIYPLFYTIENALFVVSDNPQLLLPAAPQLNLDAVNDYMHSSVMLDEKTLIEGVYQVNPSCYVVYKQGQIYSHNYFSYAIRKSEISPLGNFDDAFSRMLQASFSRLIASAQGRQLVVPLSGGYDSRLIVCMLAKMGYTNVVCYTVGKPNNPELIIAKKVAEKLGYQHLFISNEDVDYIDDKVFQAYFRYSGAFTNFFWMYEYMGVKTLTDKQLIDKDAIFVPGHSGDFLAGSQLQKAGITSETSLKRVEELILKQKFAYDNALKNHRIREKVHTFVSTRTDCLPYSVFDDFDLLIKLPKNINNAARIYGFFGHEVRLPFWDNELVNFFKILPVQVKEQQALYHTYLKKSLFTPLDVAFTEELTFPTWKMKWFRMKRKIKDCLPPSWGRYFTSPPDYVCMKEIAAPLKNEIKKFEDNHAGGHNRIFLVWYLEQVKKMLE